MSHNCLHACCTRPRVKRSSVGADIRARQCFSDLNIASSLRTSFSHIITSTARTHTPKFGNQWRHEALAIIDDSASRNTNTLCVAPRHALCTCTCLPLPNMRQSLRQCVCAKMPVSERCCVHTCNCACPLMSLSIALPARMRLGKDASTDLSLDARPKCHANYACTFTPHIRLPRIPASLSKDNMNTSMIQELTRGCSTSKDLSMRDRSTLHKPAM